MVLLIDTRYGALRKLVWPTFNHRILLSRETAWLEVKFRENLCLGGCGNGKILMDSLIRRNINSFPVLAQVCDLEYIKVVPLIPDTEQLVRLARKDAAEGVFVRQA